MKHLSKSVGAVAVFFSMQVSAFQVPSFQLPSPMQTHDENSKSKQKVFNGSCSLKNRSYENLTINGNGDLENVTVEKQIKVSGSAIINHCILAAAKINGFAQLTSTSIQDAIKCAGQAFLSDVTIASSLDMQGELNALALSCPIITLTGTSMTLEKSTVGSITVAKTMRCKNAVITLIDTTVTGSIVFQRNDGMGKVILKGTSSVVGQVEGGIVVKDDAVIQAPLETPAPTPVQETIQ